MRRFIAVALASLTGCASFVTAEDAQPVLSNRVFGLHIDDLIAMYGRPYLNDVQQGHSVYYWQSLSAYVYTPQYTATTQGTVGNTPFNSTTTMQGETQVGAVPCVLVAGTGVGTDIVERIQVRGASCESFLRK